MPKQPSISPRQARIMRSMHYNDVLVHYQFRYCAYSGPDRSACRAAERDEPIGHSNGKMPLSSIRALIKYGRIKLAPKIKERYPVYPTENYGLTASGIEELAKLEEKDFVSPPPKLSVAGIETQVLDVLRKRHPEPEWLFFQELALGTGYSPQRIDAFAFNTWPSKKLLRISYEIKVTRGDFLHELKHPEKRSMAVKISNLFYFAAPEGLIKPEEIPHGLGLIETCGDLGSKIVVQAKYKTSIEPNWSLVASICRRQKRIEEWEKKNTSSIALTV